MAGVRQVFRPSFGRALTIFVAAVCGVSAAGLTATNGSGSAARALPWLALVVGACWATFWRPEVVVEDSGVRLVNVFRTIDLPWPSIRSIDTKWALTLVTEYGQFTAWAAPAPGMHTAVRASRDDLRRVPRTARSAEGIRPGDLPATESGSAALLIRTRWQKLADAGHLDSPKLEHEAAPVVWHRYTMLAAVLLVVAAVAGLR